LIEFLYVIKFCNLMIKNNYNCVNANFQEPCEGITPPDSHQPRGFSALSWNLSQPRRSLCVQE
jgi:hypothetical protein